MSRARVDKLAGPDPLFRSLADHSPFLVWIADPSGAAVFFNQAWLMLRGRPLPRELGHGWAEGIHEEDRQAALTRYVAAVKGRKPFEMECRVLSAGGAYRPIRLRGGPWFGPDGTYLGHVGSGEDIGGAVNVVEMMDSQRRLEESEQQLRQLAARLQTAREEERAEVARQLHDGLGQTLTALKLDIGRMTEALRGTHLTPTIVDRLQSLIGLSDIGIATVRQIATTLRPPTLDHLGLAEAVRWEALTFKARTGLRCHVRANREQTKLSNDQQTALFRVFQEALTNIARHAHASAVQVTMTERSRQFELRIRDNGLGITEAQSADPHAIGLLGMKERAARIGGAFKISGRRGAGTVVSVQLPLPQEHAHPRRTRTRGARKSQ